MKKQILAFLATLLFTSVTYAQGPIKNIVLVHGAFADGSGWEAVFSNIRTHKRDTPPFHSGTWII